MEDQIMSSVRITVRSIPDSPTIHYVVNRYFNKLCKIYNKIIKCSVVVSLERKHKDKIYSVTIDIRTPGKELFCKKQNQNLFIAIIDGFQAVEKLLEKNRKKKLIFNNKYFYSHNNNNQANLAS